MNLSRLLSPVVAAAVMAVPASAAASVALPAVERSLTAASPATYTAPMSGFVTVRTSGAEGTDFDATLVDAATGRVIDRSASFTSNEVLQTWVEAGQELRLVGERRSGSGTRLSAGFTLFDVAKPKAKETAQIVEVTFNSGADLERIEAAGLDLLHGAHGDKADVLLHSDADRAKLAALGLKSSVEIADVDKMYADAFKRDAANADGTSPLPSGRTTYRTYPEIQEELKTLADANPGLVRPVVLPKKTVQGRDIQGVEIARNVDQEQGDGRPTYFVVAIHHAREWPSAEASMEFAQMLVQEADTNPDVAKILDNQRTVIVPVLNADGFVSSRSSVSVADTAGNSILMTAEAIMPPGGYFAYRRKNCGGALPAGAPCELQYGIDPNRNYGNGWGGKGAGTDPNTQSYRGPDMWSEPETQALHEYTQRRAVTSLMTLHTVGALVLRPPGRGTDGKAPDELQLKALGDAMQDSTGWESQYSFQLYDTSGTTEDWNYAAAGTLGYTIEIGPKGGQFHMPYQVGVVDQWTGTGQYAGKGLRDAMLKSALATQDPANHALLDVTAPAGTKLTLRKDFVTKSSPICTYAQGYLNSGGIPPAAKGVNCVAPGAVFATREKADFLEYTATVGDSGQLEWHVTQSTRPFVGWRFDPEGGPLDPETDEPIGERVSTGEREQWSYTAVKPDGSTVEGKIGVERGERAALTIG